MNLIHLSIKMTEPLQSGASFVRERSFQIEGFAGKRSLLSPPLPRSFHPFALATFSAGPECSFAQPEFRLPRTGTLATQAIYHTITVCFHNFIHH